MDDSFLVSKLLEHAIQIMQFVDASRGSLRWQRGKRPAS